MSKIEWTNRTWNPIAGCSKVSEGCRNCYAIGIAHRLASNPNRAIAAKYAGTTKRVAGRTDWTGVVNVDDAALSAPLRWRRPRRVFVNSMSDLFHVSVSDETITDVFGVMAATPQHVYQVLTKRPDRMRKWFDTIDQWGGAFAACRTAASVRLDMDLGAGKGNRKKWPLPNVWPGVSIEDQPTADERIPLLLATPAAVRFVSYEPALGPVGFTRVVWGETEHPFDSLRETAYLHQGSHTRPALDWVIAGGESGPGARPAHPDWFRSVRDQCCAAGVPFFFKQWGAHRPIRIRRGRGGDWEPLNDPITSCPDVFVHPSGQRPDGANSPRCAQMERVGKKAAGRVLDGRTWDEFPEKT